jgi:hypothetical protein
VVYGAGRSFHFDHDAARLVQYESVKAERMRQAVHKWAKTHALHHSLRQNALANHSAVTLLLLMQAPWSPHSQPILDLDEYRYLQRSSSTNWARSPSLACLPTTSACYHTGRWRLERTAYGAFRASFREIHAQSCVACPSPHIGYTDAIEKSVLAHSSERAD